MTYWIIFHETNKIWSITNEIFAFKVYWNIVFFGMYLLSKVIPQEISLFILKNIYIIIKLHKIQVLLLNI